MGNTELALTLVNIYTPIINSRPESDQLMYVHELTIDFLVEFVIIVQNNLNSKMCLLLISI